eukprot:CAMPEP_0117434948 /NCGR_PEP_ID=MMETSP0759-20121206/220_1 /TAXON_ID=63605 /ORGANISM="Percolomonas cosmopolitus, Strain WS" /LENGTH=214 /DNA_ID=CAMNT_0005226463 /DNA_START=1450 /DNA_END=2093 /DNA_ORIENTATION=+
MTPCLASPKQQNPNNFLRKKTKLTLEKTVATLQGSEAVSLSQLKELFVESSGSPTADFIEKDSFLELLSKRLNEQNSQILSKIFSTLDTNNDGRISFTEFVCASSILLKGDLGDKCQFIFDTADSNKDGYISREELYALLRLVQEAPRVLEEISKEYDLDYAHTDASSEEGLKSIVDSFFRMYADDSDKGLNAEQFSQLIKKNPKLLMMLTANL